MTMTKAKPAFRFLPTKLAVVCLAVAGFLGLWGAIAASAGTAGGSGALPGAAHLEPGVVIRERQLIYVVGNPVSTSSVSVGPAAAVPTKAASAPPQPTPKPTKAKKSRGS